MQSSPAGRQGSEPSRRGSCRASGRRSERTDTDDDCRQGEDETEAAEDACHDKSIGRSSSVEGVPTPRCCAGRDGTNGQRLARSPGSSYATLGLRCRAGDFVWFRRCTTGREIGRVGPRWARATEERAGQRVCVDLRRAALCVLAALIPRHFACHSPGELSVTKSRRAVAVPPHPHRCSPPSICISTGRTAPASSYPSPPSPSPRCSPRWARTSVQNPPRVCPPEPSRCRSGRQPAGWERPEGAGVRRADPRRRRGS